MTAFLIDLAVFGIIAFCAWRGYKNGLIRGVFGIVSLIIALFIANAAAQAYSKDIKAVIMPFASGLVDSTLSDMAENDIRYQAIEHDHGIEDYAFGESYTVLREIGLPEAAAVKIAEEVAVDPTIEEGIQFFIDSIADKLTNSLSYIAVFAVAFLLLAIIFSVLGNLFGFVFSLPGLKLVDTIAGSVLGLVKGVIIVLAIAMIARYFGLVAVSSLESTAVLEYLVNNNLIANMFGL